MDTATNAALVVALVEAIKQLVPTRLGGIVTIVVAVTVGALLGFAQNQDPWNGVINGLIAVGAVTTARQINK